MASFSRTLIAGGAHHGLTALRRVAAGNEEAPGE
jgi:hypothetical protein